MHIGKLPGNLKLRKVTNSPRLPAEKRLEQANPDQPPRTPHTPPPPASSNRPRLPPPLTLPPLFLQKPSFLLSCLGVRPPRASVYTALSPRRIRSHRLASAARDPAASASLLKIWRARASRCAGVGACASACVCVRTFGLACRCGRAGVCAGVPASCGCAGVGGARGVCVLCVCVWALF